LVVEASRGAIEKTDVFVKSDVDKGPLLKLLRGMPKGALLHAHFPAMVDWYTLFDALLNDDVMKGKLYFLSDVNGVMTGFSREDAVWNAPNNGHAKANTLTVFTGPALAGWKQLDRASASMIANQLSSARSWPELEHNTELTWSLIKHDGVFQIYFRLLLEAALADNLQHIELKTNLGSLHHKHYDSDKGHYTGQWMLPQYEVDEMKRVAAPFTGKLTWRLILGSHRSLSAEQMDVKMKSFYGMYMKNRDVVGGIDIFGEEDKGHSNTDYKKSLLKLDGDPNTGAGFVFSIHSGETSMVEYPVDANIAALVDLKHRVRLGHGLSMWKYPKLVEQFKGINKHVELAPLSNNILGYIPRLTDHPGMSYILNNISVSINSDDPSFFGYNYVSYDWCCAIVAWKLTLQDVYNICMNSVEASAVDDDERIVLRDTFNQSFTTWAETLTPQAQPKSQVKGGNGRKRQPTGRH
jgi:adenosine deaminase CECR1